MFQGFNEYTIKYYEALRKENSKEVHMENMHLYLEGVKQPLEELYFELYNYFSKLDSDLLSNKRKCISTAYNDARFCHEAPIKEYFYIRFKLNTANKKNALGFFLDASLDGYRYGLNIYKPDAKGMARIRDYLLDNKYFAAEMIQRFQEAGLLEVQGEMYKKVNYSEENRVLYQWIERKRISFVHEERLDTRFYNRELFEHISKAFDSVREVYFVLKEALYV